MKIEKQKRIILILTCSRVSVLSSILYSNLPLTSCLKAGVLTLHLFKMWGGEREALGIWQVALIKSPASTSNESSSFKMKHVCSLLKFYLQIFRMKSWFLWSHSKIFTNHLIADVFHAYELQIKLHFKNDIFICFSRSPYISHCSQSTVLTVYIENTLTVE